MFTADEPSAASAYAAVSAALGGLQLQPNPRKSRIRPPHLTNIEDLFLIDG